jgi:hypothetical protein
MTLEEELAEGLAQFLNQEECSRLGEYLGRANERLTDLGLENVCCIMYACGKAELIDARGKILDTFEDDDFEVACQVVLWNLEMGLKLLLTTPARPIPPDTA